MKYGPSFEDVCSRREEAASRLDRIEHRTERLEELRASIAVVRKQMDAAGQALTRARQDSAPRLAASIVRHSRELGFRQAVFEVSLSPFRNRAHREWKRWNSCLAPIPENPPSLSV
ncbi:hypothetical protein M5E88_07375 [Akkermansia muciniphila]|nr:hypothetical protein M5E88_07375 [Akkermansia muciniphila]